MNTKIENHKESYLLEILLPFLGLLAPYKIFSIPFTAIALFIVLILKRSLGKFKICSANMPFIVFFAYMVIRDLFHMLFSSGVAVSSQVNRLIEYSVLYILMFLIVDGIEENILYRSWKIAGVIFGAGMMYHVFLLVVLNQPITPLTIIPGYELRFDALDGHMRPTSFFAEPAAYVTSMMPLLFLALKRKDLKWVFISTFLIVVSTSTVGVILSAVMWVLFILFEKKSLRVTVSAILFIIIFLVLFLNLEIFAESLTKFESVAEGESTFGSRVKAPFEVVGLIDWFNLPFGNTTLNIREFVMANQMDLSAASRVLGYAQTKENIFLNTVAQLIYRYGIVGLVLFLMCFKGKIFNKNSKIRMYAIVLLIAAFGQGNISTPDIPMFLLLIYSFDFNNNKETPILYPKQNCLNE